MKRKYTIKSELKKLSAIYIISCTQTDKVYIGETINLSQRIQKHFTKLRKNNHSNPILQNVFNKYGEDTFIVDVLEWPNTEDELLLKQLELEWQSKYPTCISMDSNEIFIVERSEEWKEAQRKQLDKIRTLATEACTIAINIYDIAEDNIIYCKSVKEACKYVEKKHIDKNVKDGILIPYKGRYVAFRADSFDREQLSKIMNTKSDISVYRGEYNLYSVISPEKHLFGSKNQFSLHFSESPNDKLYDNYNNKIDFEMFATKIPETIDELYSYDLEVVKTKYKFTTTLNFELFYKAITEEKTLTNIAKRCNVDRKLIYKAFKSRSKEEWIAILQTAIARVKPV